MGKYCPSPMLDSLCRYKCAWVKLPYLVKVQWRAREMRSLLSQGRSEHHTLIPPTEQDPTLSLQMRQDG